MYTYDDVKKKNQEEVLKCFIKAQIVHLLINFCWVEKLHENFIILL